MLRYRKLEPNVAVHVTVRNVMHDLTYRPSAVSIRRVELRCVQTSYGTAHRLWCSCDLVDRCCALLRGIAWCPREFSDRVAHIHVLSMPAASNLCEGWRV